jgi:hypothetical protein
VELMVKELRDSGAFTNSSKYSLDGYNFVPTRAEKKRWSAEWARAQRFSQGATTLETITKVKLEVCVGAGASCPPHLTRSLVFSRAENPPIQLRVVRLWQWRGACALLESERGPLLT